MRFGRVDGVLLPTGDDTSSFQLTVYLDLGSMVEIVRDEVVTLPADEADPEAISFWADQLTQETIGNELAMNGWEVVAGGEPPSTAPGAPVMSAAYVVRRIG
jgi:hypothetical protein